MPMVIMKSSLSRKLHLPLVPLVLMGLVVAWLTRTSLRENPQDLIQARELKELAATSLALLLTQDDATKALMLDISNARASRRKAQAYGEIQATFEKMRRLTSSPGLLARIEQLRQIDEQQLQQQRLNLPTARRTIEH